MKPYRAKKIQAWIDRKATILLRDRNRCCYCGFQGGSDDENLTIDHIVPLSGDGTNAASNLATACLSCNRIKGDKVPQGIPKKSRDKSGRRTLDQYRRIFEQCIAGRN